MGGSGWPGGDLRFRRSTNPSPMASAPPTIHQKRLEPPSSDGSSSTVGKAVGKIVGSGVSEIIATTGGVGLAALASLRGAAVTLGFGLIVTMVLHASLGVE